MARRRIKKKLPFIIFCTLFICMMAGGYVLAQEFLFKEDGLDLLSTDEDVQLPKGSVNVLLMGMDARAGETRARTDTMILANIDNERNRMSLLSIPRDTRVSIPGHGMEKINSANIFGGPELATQTVSELVGVPVQYYVLTNWNGFKGIVDALGGVTIDVEKRMYYASRADGPEYTIDLQPGVQHMDGEKALQYVRFRSDALGDITRTDRQLKFLKSLAQEMMQAGTVTKLHKLVPEIQENVETNIGPVQMLAMAKAAKNFEQAQVVTQTLPGRFLNLNGGSYWAVEPDQARMVAKSLFEEGKVMNVVLGSTTVEGSSGNQAAPAPAKPKSKKSVAQTWNTVPEDNNSTPSDSGSVPEQGAVDNTNNPADAGSTGQESNTAGNTGAGGDALIIPGASQTDPGTGGDDNYNPVTQSPEFGPWSPNQGSSETFYPSGTGA